MHLRSNKAGPVKKKRTHIVQHLEDATSWKSMHAKSPGGNLVRILPKTHTFAEVASLSHWGQLKKWRADDGANRGFDSEYRSVGVFERNDGLRSERHECSYPYTGTLAVG